MRLLNLDRQNQRIESIKHLCTFYIMKTSDQEIYVHIILVTFRAPRLELGPMICFHLNPSLFRNWDFSSLTTSNSLPSYVLPTLLILDKFKSALPHCQKFTFQILSHMYQLSSTCYALQTMLACFIKSPSLLASVLTLSTVRCPYFFLYGPIHSLQKLAGLVFERLLSFVNMTLASNLPLATLTIRFLSSGFC